MKNANEEVIKNNKSKSNDENLLFAQLGFAYFLGKSAFVIAQDGHLSGGDSVGLFVGAFVYFCIALGKAFKKQLIKVELRGFLEFFFFFNVVLITTLNIASISGYSAIAKMKGIIVAIFLLSCFGYFQFYLKAKLGGEDTRNAVVAVLIAGASVLIGYLFGSN